jgi:hypothetical protein
VSNSIRSSQLAEVAELNSASFSKTSASSTTTFPSLFQNCHIGNINLQPLPLATRAVQKQNPKLKEEESLLNLQVNTAKVSKIKLFLFFFILKSRTFVCSFI